jgi:Zn-finger nucleic acid-binding protein
MMRTYDRAGVHIEQCDKCHGIFLDYGELEAVSRAESQWSSPPPPPPAPGYAQPQGGYPPPAWAHGGHGKYKHKSFAKLLFSS